MRTPLATVQQMRRELTHTQWLVDRTLNPRRTITLAEPGQRVSLHPDAITNPSHHGGTIFTVHKTVGNGADQFVALKDPTGAVSKWHRVSALTPPVTTAEAAAIAKQKQEEQLAPDALQASALRIAVEQQLSLRDSLSQAAMRDPAAVESYRRLMDSGPRDRQAPIVISLSDQVQRDGQRALRDVAERRLLALAQAIQASEQCSWSDALSLASVRDPESAAVYLSARNDRGGRG